jgi:TPR repeat protein
LYFTGNGVRQDYHKAKQWYEKAAKQGAVGSQYMLGYMYENGLGVRQNLSEAKEWYGKACDNGYQKGCEDYARLNRSR